MEEIQVIYPVERLLANPRLFYAIAKILQGPDGETLKSAFYDILEYDLQNFEDPEDCEFLAEEVCFKCEEDGESCGIYLDSGIASLLKAVEGEVKAQITNDNELAASSAIYQRIVQAIEEEDPNLSGNIALCSPPTPGNSYLRSKDGDRFEGEFHLLSDPDLRYQFHIDVIDVANDNLKAHIKRL